jgi:hypothetical protein
MHEVGVILLYLKNYIFADDTAYPMLIHRVLVGNIWNWISAFLNNRQQRVVLDGDVSSQMPVVSGVPQGFKELHFCG